MRTKLNNRLLGPPTRLSRVVASAAVFISGCSSVTTALTAPPPALPSLVRVQEPLPPPAREPLVVADFDRAGHVTNFGTPFGSWDRDPNDTTQFCRIRLVDTHRLGQMGYGLLLEYDVDSPNPAYNGFWMQFPAVSLHRYEVLSLAIKGDASRGFTQRVWLELKGRSRVARFLLEGIASEWKRMRVPLREFLGIEQLRQVSEFVIVFDDETVTEKIGILYLDEVAFEPAA